MNISGISNTDRRDWIMNNENWYNEYNASRMSMREFIMKNEVDIDNDIATTLHPPDRPPVRDTYTDSWPRVRPRGGSMDFDRHIDKLDKCIEVLGGTSRKAMPGDSMSDKEYLSNEQKMCQPPRD